MGRKSTGSVYLKGGRWYARITFDGKRYAKVVPERKDKRALTKEYAEKFLLRWQELIDAGQWFPEDVAREELPSEKTVSAYIEEYLAKQKYETVVDDRRRWKRYIAPSDFGKMIVSEVRPRHVLTFLERLQELPSRRGGNLAPRSVRNIYSVVQCAFARAVLDEVFAVSPCDAVAKAGELPAIRDKTPGERTTWKYSREEVRLLCTSERVPIDRRVFYSLLFFTGARLGEIAALRWKDFDRSSKPLARLTISLSHQSSTRKIKGTKTGAIREVPVHPSLLGVLLAWQEQSNATPERLVIPNKLDRPRTTSSSHQMLGRDCERLGISLRGMQQHSMRHTLITLAREDGANGSLLRWVTHTPPGEQLDQYTSPSWESLCAELGKLRLDLDKGTDNGTDK